MVKWTLSFVVGFGLLAVACSGADNDGMDVKNDAPAVAAEGLTPSAGTTEVCAATEPAPTGGVSLASYDPANCSGKGYSLGAYSCCVTCSVNANANGFCYGFFGPCTCTFNGKGV